MKKTGKKSASVGCARDDLSVPGHVMKRKAMAKIPRMNRVSAKRKKILPISASQGIGVVVRRAERQCRSSIVET